MARDLAARKVEVSFAGQPPGEKIARAGGVSADVHRTGSFQPFLEALPGHEVIAVTSTPIDEERSRRWR